QAAQIPVFRTPEPAVEMFAHVSSFYRNQRMLMQAPGPLSRQTPPDVEAARALVASVLADHRTVFSSAESKSLLAMFNIPVGRTVAASSAAEAVGAARELGFPVAVKIDSPDITHKTDVGGVRLDLPDAEAVAAAYDGIIAAAQQRRPDAHISGVTVERMVKRANARELMIGIMTDKVFGPAVTFAAGGTAVEVLQDRTVGLPPLNRFLTEEMIRETRISRMLGTFRNMPPADVNGIASVLLRVSEMACELPWLRELDINPLFADDTGVIAADARIVIAPHVPAAQPYAHMAIHPYPTELVSEWRAADGTSATIRPIRPEDATIESDFVQSLSPQAKYLRFMAAVKDLTPAMLARFTQVDYDREMALIAVLDDAGRERQIGVTRYIINPDGQSCEFAIVVSEAWQGRGLGRHLMLQLIAVARTRGLKTMLGQVLAVNTHMLALAAALGFFIRDTPGDLSVKEVGFELRKGAV
ncbi:MAG: GNAT family N-acetyltransferase, partial [Burkholderiales bacterium]